MNNKLNHYIKIVTTTNFPIQCEFTIKPGITCLIGDSGAGKSSILRMIAGLDKEENNVIAINSIWQNQKKFVPAFKRKIAFAMQGDNLFKHLNVQQNINLIKKDHSLSDFNLRDNLKITALLHKFPNELSGGEKQRVALYKSLITQAEIILLDEPLSAIDTHHKKHILQILQKIKSKINKPIIYVSHNYDEVAQLADQIICIHQGKIEFNKTFSNDALITYFQKNEPNQIATYFNMKLNEQNLQPEFYEFMNEDFKIKSVTQPKINLEEYRIKVLAKDVSICTEKPLKSSILNILPATIVHLVHTEKSTLVESKVGNSRIYSLISQYSFKQLNLKQNDAIWLQIKAVNIQ